MKLWYALQPVQMAILRELLETCLVQLGTSLSWQERSPVVEELLAHQADPNLGLKKDVPHLSMLRGHRPLHSKAPNVRATKVELAF